MLVRSLTVFSILLAIGSSIQIEESRSTKKDILSSNLEIKTKESDKPDDGKNVLPSSTNSAAPSPPIEVEGEDLIDEVGIAESDSVPKKEILQCPGLTYINMYKHGYKNYTELWAESIDDCADKCSDLVECDLFEFDELDATTDIQNPPCRLYIPKETEDLQIPSNGATACLRMVSKQSCPDLGFSLEDMDTESCEFSCSSSDCPSGGDNVQFNDAWHYCEGQGARLCNAEEIRDEFAQAPIKIWTYEECGIFGSDPASHTTVSNVGTGCAQDDKATGRIRCCADKYGRLTKADYYSESNNETETETGDSTAENVSGGNNSTHHRNGNTNTNSTFGSVDPNQSVMLDGIALQMSKGRQGYVRLVVHKNEIANPTCLVITEPESDKDLAQKDMDALDVSRKNASAEVPSESGVKIKGINSGENTNEQRSAKGNGVPGTGSVFDNLKDVAAKGEREAEANQTLTSTSKDASSYFQSLSHHRTQKKSFQNTLAGKSHSHVPHKHTPHSHTLRPTKFPTNFPTGFPSPFPTPKPTTQPTKGPTAFPSPKPTMKPTAEPTGEPTTPHPTDQPTKHPTNFPTAKPTKKPTMKPTPQPTRATKGPTMRPTNKPTDSPTDKPTAYPTGSPTKPPTSKPSTSPTSKPTKNPTTLKPSSHPSTLTPTTSRPTAYPTSVPTLPPSQMNGYLTTGSCTQEDGGSVWVSDTRSGMIMSGGVHPHLCLSLGDHGMQIGAPVGVARCDSGNSGMQWVLPDENDPYGQIALAHNTSLCLSKDKGNLGGKDSLAALSLQLCDSHKNNEMFEVHVAASNLEMGDLDNLSQQQVSEELIARGIQPGKSDLPALKTQLDKMLAQEERSRDVESEENEEKTIEEKEKLAVQTRRSQDPDSMTKSQLITALEKRGLTTYGPKHVLADRLSDALEEELGGSETLSIISDLSPMGHTSQFHKGKCVALRGSEDMEDLKATCPQGMAIMDLVLEPCGTSTPGGLLDNSTIAGSHSIGGRTINQTANLTTPGGFSSVGGVHPAISRVSFLETETAWYPTNKIYNKGKECWVACDRRGGLCRTGFCGAGGYCCKKGHPDAGCGYSGNRGCNGTHCCIAPPPPTFEPTNFPSLQPTPEGRLAPSNKPTPMPSNVPTIMPSSAPSVEPTSSPTIAPIPHLRYSYSCATPLSTYGRCAAQETECMDVRAAQNIDIDCPTSSSLSMIHHHSVGCDEGKMKIKYECCGTLFASVLASSRWNVDPSVKPRGVIGDIAGVTVDTKALRLKKDCKKFSTECTNTDTPLLNRRMACPTSDWVLTGFTIDRKSCQNDQSKMVWSCCMLANSAVNLHSVSTNRKTILFPASSQSTASVKVPGALGATAPQGFQVEVEPGSIVKLTRIGKAAGKRKTDMGFEHGWDKRLHVAVTIGYTWFPMPSTAFPVSGADITPRSLGGARQKCIVMGDQCSAITPDPEGMGFIPASPHSVGQLSPTGGISAEAKIPGKADGRFVVTPGGGSGLAMCLHPKDSFHAQTLCCNDQGRPQAFNGCKLGDSAARNKGDYITAEQTCKAAGLVVCAQNGARSHHALPTIQQCGITSKRIKVWTSTPCIPQAFPGVGEKGRSCSDVSRTSTYPQCILECRMGPGCKAVMWKPSVQGPSICELASKCAPLRKRSEEIPTIVGKSSKRNGQLRLVGSLDDDGEEVPKYNVWHTLRISETGVFGKVADELAEMPARFQFIEDGSQTTASFADFLTYVADANDLIFGGNSMYASVMHRVPLSMKMSKLFGAKPGRPETIVMPQAVRVSIKYSLVITDVKNSTGTLFSLCDATLPMPDNAIECPEYSTLWSIVFGNEQGTLAGRKLAPWHNRNASAPTLGETYFVLGRHHRNVTFDTLAPTSISLMNAVMTVPIPSPEPVSMPMLNKSTNFTGFDLVPLSNISLGDLRKINNFTEELGFNSTLLPANLTQTSAVPNNTNITNITINPPQNITKNTTKNTNTDTKPLELCPICVPLSCKNTEIQPVKGAMSPCGCPACITASGPNPVMKEDGTIDVSALVNQTASVIVGALADRFTAPPTSNAKKAKNKNKSEKLKKNENSGGKRSVKPGPGLECEDQDGGECCGDDSIMHHTSKKNGNVMMSSKGGRKCRARSLHENHHATASNKHTTTSQKRNYLTKNVNGKKTHMMHKVAIEHGKKVTFDDDDKSEKRTTFVSGHINTNTGTTNTGSHSGAISTTTTTTTITHASASVSPGPGPGPSSGRVTVIKTKLDGGASDSSSGAHTSIHVESYSSPVVRQGGHRYRPAKISSGTESGMVQASYV